MTAPRQLLRHATLALGLLALAAAATRGSAQGTTTLVGGFDVGPGGTPGIYNPLQASAGLTWFQKYYSSLLLYDVNFTKLQGDLASSWTVSSDGKTYTFVLRPNVRWHDGRPFTAEDVKFTIELNLNPDAGSLFQSRLSDISRVTATGQRVTLTLSRPNAALLDTLTSVVILPRHALASIAPRDIPRSDWWRTRPIGTGPYKWGRLVADQFVELEAFEGYWRGRPKVDRLVNRYFREAGSAVLALRSGDIQFTYVTADEAAALRNDPNVSIIAGPSQVANYIGFNNNDPRFKDVRVRQAIMHAIDRQTIINTLYGGGAVPVNCIYSNARYVPRGLNAYAYSPDRARQLLREAGWAGGSVELLTYYGDKLSSDVMVAMQQMLAQVGVQATLRAVDVPTYRQTVTGNNFAFVFAGQGNGPDPDLPTQSFGSADIPPAGANYMKVNLPALDRLIAQGRLETNAGKRALAYQSLCKLFNEQLPWAPLWVAQRFGAVSKRVSNFVWTPAPGGGRYYDAAEAWTLGR